MSSSPLRDPQRARAAGGFTLVEVIVSLVIVSIFGTVLFQLIRSQGTFVALQGARSEAQQNVRGALEIMASDLRAAPAGSLVSATARSVTLNVPRAWGIACGSAIPSTTQLDAVFPAVPGGISTQVSTVTGLTGDTDPAPDVTNFMASVGSVTAINAIPLTSSSDCTGVQPSGQFVVYRFTGVGFPVVPAHQSVFVHDRVAYSVAQGTDNLYWLQRSYGATPQPLAGPLPDADGLRLTYFSTALAPIPVANFPAALGTVGRVRVDMTARSRVRINRQAEMERDSITVSLRN